MKPEHKQIMLECIKESIGFGRETDKFAKAIGNHDLPMLNAVWDMQCRYVDTVEFIIGDKDEWLGWYIFENDCGDKELEAGYGKEMHPINTEDDLIELIDEGSKRA